MRFYRLFTAFVLFLLIMAVVPLCCSSTIIDRHNPGGQKVRIEINDVTDSQDESRWQVSLLIQEGFDDQNSILRFKAPLVSADSSSIALLVTNDRSDYCNQMVMLKKEQTPVLQYLTQQASKNGTLGWLDFLNIQQLTDVGFCNTLLQRAASSCPASESLQWQLSCFKLFLERTVLKTNHNAGLKAVNGDGQPSGSAPDPQPKDQNNHHQKEKREEPEDQENQSPGEGHDGSENGNNRKDDDGKENEKNPATQDLQVLANQLVAIIESADPDAAFTLRQILDELDIPQRLQVLETKSTNTMGNPVSPLEAILELQRSFYENSLRNRFIEQLIEATSDKTRTLNDPDILSSLQPILPADWTPPEAGDNNLMILHKIVQDLIHRVSQSDEQPPIGQFEKCCFVEYCVQLFLLYSNPVESIRELLGKLSDSVISRDIVISAQSLTFSISFRETFIQLEQHPSFHELEHLSNDLMSQTHTSHSLQELLIEPVIGSSDNTSCEIIASNANTFTDFFQQVNSYQGASGSNDGFSGLPTDRNLQPGSSPKHPALAVQQTDSSQKRFRMRHTHGLPPDPSAIHAGDASNAGSSSDDHETRNLNRGLEKSERLVNESLSLRKANQLKKSTQKKQKKKVRQMAAVSPAMQSNGAECRTSCQQSSIHNEETTPSNEPLRTTEQKARKPLCNHYHRLCRVNFECCTGYFPCHRCHNASDDCDVTERKAFEARKLQCSLCNYEGNITENSQTCPQCNVLMSEYFCAKCKHFTNMRKKPYHCDKCGICRIHTDSAFHCDVCNVCYDIGLKDNHKCRENSGHDECCICLEDVFNSCCTLPCTHKLHRSCATEAIQNGIKTCPLCRYPLYTPLVENYH
ncbi:CHY zinc finger protein [Endozoicomonas sp. ISHI1]|uniref:CHY zinc finger protein n=1 Tax=Endozoicomonas sp. ISHI1 TaxID=2825882 RepID=UPI002148260F|nr:CHY zinc finger protein [Endozoicomonas sp. ISHI1]